MKAVIQRAQNASVTVDNQVTGSIEEGFVILLGITHDDNNSDIDYLVDKICNLRLFEANEKHFEQSLAETHKKALVVSQFTLYADTKKGRRPDFSHAAKPDEAKKLYEKFIQKLEDQNIKVESGIFGASMKVALTNNGPITIILESKTKK